MIVTKNIIFDLGGVLLDIDYQKSITAFKNLGIENFEDMFSQFQADELFEKLETGSLNDVDFYSAIKKRTKAAITDEEIINAWNAMILNFRTQSLDVLEELSGKYRLFLLSNTNSIHLNYFQQLFTKETGKPFLDKYFSKTWYSHKVGLRKPGRKIFEFVLQDENLKAGETLFIDDSINNIKGAEELGIKTRLLKINERIEDILL